MLANGLLFLAIELGHVDQAYVAARTQGWPEVRRAVADCWPAQVERVTGVAEPALREAVRLLAEAVQDLILTARGAERHAHGVARFTSFVNAPDVPDPSNAFVQERGQVRPARPDEKGPTLVAGPVLEVVRA